MEKEKLVFHDEYSIDDDIFDAATCMACKSFLYEAGQDAQTNLHITVNSIGGFTAAAFYLMQCVEETPATVVATGVGRVESIAAIFLQSCDVRRMDRDCIMTLHAVYSTRYDFNVYDALNDVLKRFPSEDAIHICEIHERLQDEHKLMLAYLQKRTQKHPGFLNQLIKRNTTLSADEALKFNLIDEIVELDTD